MGLLDRFSQFVRDPRAQALMGSLSRNIGGAPPGYLGAALGQAGGEISDYLAELEERRAREEERKRELELEAEDRAMRRTSWEQNQEDRKLAAMEKEAERLAGFARRGTLKAEALDRDLPDLVDMVDADPEGVAQLLKEHDREKMKPKEPATFNSWTPDSASDGQYLMRTDKLSGEPEYRENPNWKPKVKEAKEGALTDDEKDNLREMGVDEKSIKLMEIDPVFGRKILETQFPELVGGGEEEEGSKRPTTSQILNEVQQLITKEGGPFWIRPKSTPEEIKRITADALEFVHEQIENIEALGGDEPAPPSPQSTGLQQWKSGNRDPFSGMPTSTPRHKATASPTATTTTTPTPIGPDPTDEYLLDEDGSLIARAIPSPTTTPTRNPARTASPSPTPTQVEAQRGGLRKQDPRDVAGQTVGGTVLPDPAFAPPGDAVMTPVHHGGARKSEAAAVVSASFQNTLAQAKQTLPKVRGEEGNKIIELAVRSLQEKLITEEELNELLQAEIAAAMQGQPSPTSSPTASPSATPSATPSPTGLPSATPAAWAGWKPRNVGGKARPTAQPTPTWIPPVSGWR